MPYYKQNAPLKIPAEGGKTILEHFGQLTTHGEKISIANMIAPPGWSEPFQNPEFDEYTLVSSGRKQIEIDGETVVVGEGESILVSKGSRVRYSNPFDEPCVYWSVCVPAFSVSSVHREE